jgi:hypothetical protein
VKWNNKPSQLNNSEIAKWKKNACKEKIWKQKGIMLNGDTNEHAWMNLDEWQKHRFLQCSSSKGEQMWKMMEIRTQNKKMVCYSWMEINGVLNSGHVGLFCYHF